MYAGQYRNNPILENRAKSSNLSKTREFKPKPNFTNNSTHLTPKRKDISKIFSSVPLMSWLFTNSTSKVMKSIASYFHISSYRHTVIKLNSY